MADISLVLAQDFTEAPKKLAEKQLNEFLESGSDFVKKLDEAELTDQFVDLFKNLYGLGYDQGLKDALKWATSTLADQGVTLEFTETAE